MKINPYLPLVVSCSGCCYGGELADDIASILKQQGKVVQISIAAIAAQSPMHMSRVKRSRHLIAFDGCALQCVKTCLTRNGIDKFIHFDITNVIKESSQPFHKSNLQRELQVTSIICRKLAPILTGYDRPQPKQSQTNIIALFPCAEYEDA